MVSSLRHLQVGGQRWSAHSELLPRLEKFRRILGCCSRVRGELSVKARPSLYTSNYVPTVTCGHEGGWVVTERRSLLI